MITGVRFLLNGVEREVPPLNIKQMKALKKEFKEIEVARQAKLDDDSPEKAQLEDSSFDATVKIVHAAIQRNYPDYTMDMAESDIDMENISDLIQAAMGHRDLVEGKRKARALAMSTGTASQRTSSLAQG